MVKKQLSSHSRTLTVAREEAKFVEHLPNLILSENTFSSSMFLEDVPQFPGGVKDGTTIQIKTTLIMLKG